MYIKLDKSQIRRYAGYKEKFKIIPEIEEKIDILISEIKQKARVKYTYEIFDVSVLEDEVKFADISFKSRFLAKNLKCCDKIILLAITLGNEVDSMIRRYSTIDGTSMILVQAIAAEYLEKYIDEIEKEILSKIDKKVYFKPRFSPGYSDLDIVHQKDVINILNATKKIGLSTTSSYMLTPAKSVTAIIGITDTDYKNVKNKCNSCMLANCSMREK